MATKPKGMDRRVLRTRQMIVQAFKEILREKGFDAMTVQDIADHANVNRGTFYAHFADKYVLIDVVIREEFKRHLTNQLPPEAGWDNRSLHLLISTVLEFFGQCYPSDVVGSLVKRAAHEELSKILTEWLNKAKRDQKEWQVPQQTIVQVITWVISGATEYWTRDSTNAKRPPEQIASEILLVMTEGLKGMVSN
mgnify:CR=1 FL=1